MNKNFKLLWLFLVSQPIYLSLTRKEFQGNLMMSWVYLAVKCSSEWFFKCIFWVIFLCVVYIQPWDAPQGGSSSLYPKRMDWDQKTQSGQHVPAMNQREGAPRQKAVVSCLLALPLAGRCLCSFAGLCTNDAATSALLLHSFFDVWTQFLHPCSRDWRPAALL